MNTNCTLSPSRMTSLCSLFSPLYHCSNIPILTRPATSSQIWLESSAQLPFSLASCHYHESLTYCFPQRCLISKLAPRLVCRQGSPVSSFELFGATLDSHILVRLSLRMETWFLNSYAFRSLQISVLFCKMVLRCTTK